MRYSECEMSYLRADKCPKCTGDLDTGWQCTSCKFDAGSPISWSKCEKQNWVTIKNVGKDRLVVEVDDQVVIDVFYVSGEIELCHSANITGIIRPPEPMPDTAAYAPGNQASKEAAKKIRGKLTGIRSRVHDFISIQGSLGATGSEISEALDILPYTAKPRCSELRDAGLIVDSGMMRENKNGGKETVWILSVDNPHQRGDNPSTL